MPIVLKSGNLNLLEPSGPVQACNGIALPFYSLDNNTEGRSFRLLRGGRLLHKPELCVRFLILSLVSLGCDDVNFGRYRGTNISEPPPVLISRVEEKVVCGEFSKNTGNC